MKTITFLLLAGVLLLGATPLAWAREDGTTFVESSAVAGYHYLDGKDFLSRLAEYSDLDEEELIQPDLRLEMFGGTDSALYRIMALYDNQFTNGFGLQIEGAKNWRATAKYQSFYHNLDRDLMDNLNARELGPATNTDGSFKPGGKMVFHSDADPDGVYGIRYERFDSEVEVDVPWLPNTTVHSRYHDQKRQGYKQVASLSHCAVCHVESNGRRVDEQTQTWSTGFETTVDRFSLSYEYTATHFSDYSSGVKHKYLNAMHPIKGNTDAATGANYGVEFGSRLAFEDVELTDLAPRQTHKQMHEAGARLDLSAASVLRAGYNHSERTNDTVGIQSEYDSYLASFISKPTKTTRVSGRVFYYETKVDDVDVDLPDFRAGRPGGDLDMDWTRISAANRQVLQADLNAGWRWRKGGYLKGNYRYRAIDRDAMTQSQVTYVGIDNDGDGLADVNERLDAVPFANKTVENRFQLLASQRLGRKGSVRVRATVTAIDDPYGNPTGICEEAPTDSARALYLVGAPNYYYFQRQRYGNASERPTLAQRYSAQGSYQLSPRTSLGAYATLGMDENDDLNSYDFERTMLSLGAHGWTAPSDRVLLTVGYAFNSIESNAKLCPPLFDG